MADPDEIRPGEGIVITRVLDAPRETVWREWTTPEAFADWYGGEPGRVPVDSVTMDVREGGNWSLTMFAGPQELEIQWEGTYLEVSEPERLVFTVTDQPGGGEYEVVTVALTELDGGRTEMRMTQTGGHLGPEEYERAKQGWGGFFDRMTARLSER
jgi:uncharacterized protein YndB with AHSA1/START domain